VEELADSAASTVKPEVRAYMRLLDTYPHIARRLQSAGSPARGMGRTVSGSSVWNSELLLDSAEHGEQPFLHSVIAVLIVVDSDGRR
jgi:predicted Zn-dependent protease